MTDEMIELVLAVVEDVCQFRLRGGAEDTIKDRVKDEWQAQSND